MLSNDAKQELLATIGFFHGCTEAELRDVAHLTGERRVPAGVELCQQGAFENDVYVVVGGEAEVIVDGVLSGRTRVGEIVGELSMLGTGKRAGDLHAPSLRCTFSCSILARSIPSWRPTLRQPNASANTVVKAVLSRNTTG